MTSKKILFQTILILFSTAIFGQKSPADSSGLIYETRFPLSYQVTAGYTNFMLGQVRDDYTADLQDFSAAGITLDDSERFPASPVYEFELLLHVREDWRLGGSIGYATTDASSTFDGAVGTVDVRNEISMWTLMFDARKHFTDKKGLVPFAGARLGMLLGFDQYRESTNLTLSIEDSVQVFERDGRGIGPMVEFYGGFQQYAGDFYLSLSAGFRLAVLPGMQGDLSIDGQQAGSGSFLRPDGEKLRYNYSGFIVKFGIGHSVF